MTMDFAIDPALLEEEGMQDAEGEADDTYMVEAVCQFNRASITRELSL